MDADELPLTGTCDLSTVGRRSGHRRRVEIWYVIVDEQIVVTGTPGARHWLANLREHPEAVLHLRDPDRDVAVTAEEVTDKATRRRVAGEAWHLQPWYAEQPFSIEDWVTDSPMVILTPTVPDRSGARTPSGRL
jgi:deazaflavin-dependent oxidoreductase (nitroreductase family)